jgi:hypothetical protein
VKLWANITTRKSRKGQLNGIEENKMQRWEGKHKTNKQTAPAAAEAFDPILLEG